MEVAQMILGGIFLLNMAVMVWAMRKLDRLDAEHARRVARIEECARLIAKEPPHDQ